jgi:hypothetical protein
MCGVLKCGVSATRVFCNEIAGDFETKAKVE